MADLTQSVSDLQQAVDNIHGRFAEKVQELQDALSAANQALADEELDDAAKDSALSDALQQADTAASAIGAQVERLNSIGQGQDPGPEEPEVPAEGGPHPDNTLPGDQPHPDQSLPGDQPHPDQSLPDDQPYVDPRKR